MRRRGVSWGCIALFALCGCVLSSVTVHADAGVFTQQQVLLASDGVPGDAFGRSVAVSRDNSTVVVGTPGGAMGQGAVYVFRRNPVGPARPTTSGPFMQVARLTAGDGAVGTFYGHRVAVNADGTAVLVGAFAKGIGANTAQGAAYVYTITDAGTFGLRLTASDGAAFDQFGAAVAMSDNGGQLLIGAPGKTVGANGSQGVAYLFTRSGSGIATFYMQTARLTASNGAATDQFGKTVAISGPGDFVLIGAPTKIVGGVSRGQAYVFAPLFGGYFQIQRITDADATEGAIGFSVALSGDGQTAAVESLTTDERGVIYAYAYSSSLGEFVRTQRLIANDSASSTGFGFSVALNYNGNTMVIGGSARAYVLVRGSSGYTEASHVPVVVTDPTAPNFAAVAVSGDAVTVIVGIENPNSPNAGAGAVYAFLAVPNAASMPARPTTSGVGGPTPNPAPVRRPLMIPHPAPPPDEGTAPTSTATPTPLPAPVRR